MADNDPWAGLGTPADPTNGLSRDDITLYYSYIDVVVDKTADPGGELFDQAKWNLVNANMDRAAALFAHVQGVQHSTDVVTTNGAPQTDAARLQQSNDATAAAICNQWRTASDAQRAARLAALRQTYGSNGPGDIIGSKEFGYLVGLEQSSPLMKQVMLDPWYTTTGMTTGGTPPATFNDKMRAATSAAVPFVPPPPPPPTYLVNGQHYDNLNDAMTSVPIPPTPTNPRPGPYEGANVATIPTGPSTFVAGDFARASDASPALTSAPVLLASPVSSIAPGAATATKNGHMVALLAILGLAAAVFA